MRNRAERVSVARQLFLGRGSEGVIVARSPPAVSQRADSPYLLRATFGLVLEKGGGE
jgi:hypothetical protein